MIPKWDIRFLALAEHVAQWSKDPSTKTGSVIVDDQRRVVGMGYNGFPRGIQDTEERLETRKVKYSLMVHCEMNALLNANGDVSDCTLYTWPFASCERCAVHMIQAGIKRAVAPEIPDALKDRWHERLKIAGDLYREAGVEVVTVG